MPDEKTCREYLIQQRWNGCVTCPYCNHNKVYVIEDGKRFKCAAKTCYKKFSVTVGTMMEASNIPLTKWLAAIYVKTKVVNAPTKKNATDFIEENTLKGITLVTDSSPIYHKIGKKYNHIAINHSEGQYALNGFHTNSIENYWSVLKRGIYGIYHQVSPKHLQSYCDEFNFRFNNRKMKDADRFKMSLQLIQSRLTYKTLTAKPNFPIGGKEVDQMMEE